MPPVFRRIDGTHGFIEIPMLGTRIGEIGPWTLTRRGEAHLNPQDPEAAEFDLTATLTLVPNEALWNDPDYEKRVVISMRRGKRTWTVQPVEGPGQRTALNGRSLIMERVITHDV